MNDQRIAQHDDHTIEIHRKQYASTELERHKAMTFEGLRKHERIVITKHLRNPCLYTLEIGCGTGRVSFGLEEELRFLRITATDFVDKFIETAVQMGTDRKSLIQFRTCSATELPFDDNAFQYIVCFGAVLSHLPHRKQRIQALQEFRRVLKDDGILIVSVKNILYKNWHMPFLKLLTGLTRTISNPYGYENTSLPRLGTGGKFDPLFLRRDKPVLHYYYPDELVHDFVSTDFSVVDLFTSAQNLDELGTDGFRGDGVNIYAVGRKKLYVHD